eukprot:359015-Chlamydomonas_euryale.AAC.4
MQAGGLVGVGADQQVSRRAGPPACPAGSRQLQLAVCKHEAGDEAEAVMSLKSRPCNIPSS